MKRELVPGNSSGFPDVEDKALFGFSTIDNGLSAPVSVSAYVAWSRYSLAVREVRWRMRMGTTLKVLGEQFSILKPGKIAKAS